MKTRVYDGCTICTGPYGIDIRTNVSGAVTAESEIEAMSLAQSDAEDKYPDEDTIYIHCVTEVSEKPRTLNQRSESSILSEGIRRKKES